MCVLQQPKPGEPLYAQVNLEKKKKRQYELGVGQGQAGGGAIPGGGGGGGGGVTGPGGGGGGGPTSVGQWIPDGVGVPDGNASVAATVTNVPPNSTAAAAAGDSWV